MKLRNIACVTGTLVCLLSTPVISQGADDWVAINDPAELRALYSNKTWTLMGPDAHGHYNVVTHYSADGRGVMIHEGDSFSRTWEVKGKDQVCATAAGGTRCYRFERLRGDPNTIAVEDVDGGEKMKFKVEDGIPKF